MLARLQWMTWKIALALCVCFVAPVDVVAVSMALLVSEQLLLVGAELVLDAEAKDPLGRRLAPLRLQIPQVRSCVPALAL